MCNKLHELPTQSYHKLDLENYLMLVHSDVWGLPPIMTKHGYRYVLTFIDDYSHRAFCYPLHNNDEIYSKLEDFIAMVDKQTGIGYQIITMITFHN